MLKNVTLSADENFIKKARIRAKKENKSLNALFREWLARYVRQETQASQFKKIMDSLDYVQPGKVFNRDEMNVR